MLSVKKPNLSPSRTYVAICYSINFDRVYFKKFVVPEEHQNHPSWYFLHWVDITACIEDVIPWEQFTDVRDNVEA